jgi:hypothetical protein
MYIIAPQFIRDYITEKFSDVGKLSANGREFILESIFVEKDWKRHMSINVDSGLWQCFKTGRTGNFISFYAHVENISYFKAQRNLTIKNFEFLGEEPHQLEEPSSEYSELDISKLQPVSLSSAYSEDKNVLLAWSFLFGRNLFSTKIEEKAPFYLCMEGKFHNRIIIPFRKDNIVYYYQGRTLTDARPKYLNPSVEIAPKPSNILYPYDEEADSVVVCEGPLDAISLQLNGVNATCTIGSTVSPVQAEILSTFPGRIIMGYDNDEAGQRGIEKFDVLRRERNMNEFDVCLPPSKYKDWNAAHIASEDLNSYISMVRVGYDYEYKIRSSLETL